MRIPEGMQNIIKATVAVGATGATIGKLIVGRAIFSVVLIPAGTTLTTLFLISVIPSAALFIGIYLANDGEVQRPNFLSTRSLIMIWPAMAATLKLAAASSIPAINVFAFSILAVSVTTAITQPLVSILLEFTFHTIPGYVRGF